MSTAMHMAKQDERGLSPLVIVFCALSSLACALYLELFHGTVHLHRTGLTAGLNYSQDPATLLRPLGIVAAISIVLFVAMLVLAARRSLLDTLHQYRLPIALIIVAACTFLRLSGSSIAMWSWPLGTEDFQGTLFGVPRIIRTDEWTVFTPFSISQATSGFKAISPILRGGGTDVTMVYAQPSWALATLFRPFLWGYLALGAEHGLAFFWTARLAALALVAYQLGLMVADGRRSLAAALAMLVCGAGAIQWWFAVNGTAELIIFGGGLVLALERLLHARTTPARWGWSALLAWLLPCYAFILYPAWQVPFVYVFAAMGIWVIVRWAGETPRDERGPQLKSCSMPLVICTLIAGGLAAFAMVSSWDAIRAVMESAYPGRRVETGGGLLPELVEGSTALMTSVNSDVFAPNVVEAAAFFGLMPAGIAFGVARGIRRHDVLSIALGLACAAMLAYGLVGFPEPLARVTALSNVTSSRLMLPLGFADVALLMRGIAQGDDRMPRRLPLAGRTCGAVAASLAFSIAVVFLGRAYNPLIMNRWGCLISGIAAMLLALSATLPGDALEHLRAPRGTLVLAASAIVLLGGACVNPVQQGTAALTQSDFYQAVSSISADDPEARWIGDDVYVSQACAAAGAPTITTIHTYPAHELWAALDPSGEQADTYNRYAHIEAIPTRGKTEFELVFLDDFELHLNPDDADKLGVRYWASYEDLASWDTDRTAFVPIAEAGPLTIYRLDAK